MHLHTQDGDGREIGVTAEYIRNRAHSPWTKPWGEDHVEIHAMKPFNPISGTVYSNDNAMRLYLPLLEMFRLDPSQIIDLRFSTLNQLERHSATVRAGADSFTVIASISDDKTKWKKYTVYNYRDVIFKGLDRYEDYRLRKFNWSMACERLDLKGAAERAVQMVQNCGVRIMSAMGMQSSFVPHENTVYIARPECFDSKEKLFEVLFHELAHWTKFNLPGCRRTYGYAQEEIVAQQVMFLLMDYFGFGVNDGMMDYLSSWLTLLTMDDAQYVWEDALGTSETVFKRLLSFI